MSSAAATEQAADGLPLPRRRIAFLAMAISIAMAVLDGSIANTALPTIARDLHADVSSSIWVVNGFQVAVSATLLTFAALGQLKGPGRIYRIGVIAFVIGSLVCALARSLPVLIAARAFQGLGASAVMSISPAILREIFPRAQLGRALGLNALVVATSTAAGPTIGGIVLAFAPWPWIFAINVPLGLLNIALNRALPDDERAGGWPDALSVVTSALGFALTVWGLDGFARNAPLWQTIPLLLVGVSSAVIFVRRQFTLAQPMISLDLFRIPPFAMAAATSGATFISQGMAYVALPFFFQESLGRTPLESGLLLTSWPLSIAVVAPIAGRLADRYPVGILATLGLAVFTISMGLYASLPAHPSSLEIVACGVVCGLGFGFFQSPNNRELIGSAPRSKTASASGILATLRVGGQTFGTAIVAIVFGLLGASISNGTPAATVVGHASPVVLWVACACAAIATCASALRLRRLAPRAAAAA